jgi:hypothetical protein
VRGRGGFGPVLGFSGGLTECKNSFGVEFFPGRVSPVGWAAFPAGKGITEQGLRMEWGRGRGAVPRHPSTRRRTIDHEHRTDGSHPALPDLRTYLPQSRPPPARPPSRLPSRLSPPLRTCVNERGASRRVALPLTCPCQLPSLLHTRAEWRVLLEAMGVIAAIPPRCSVRHSAAWLLPFSRWQTLLFLRAIW